jgi:hypothetical protein
MAWQKSTSGQCRHQSLDTRLRERVKTRFFSDFTSDTFGLCRAVPISNLTASGELQMQSCRCLGPSFLSDLAEFGRRTSTSDESTLNPISARSNRVESPSPLRDQQLQNAAQNRAPFLLDSSASLVLSANPDSFDLRTRVGQHRRLPDSCGGTAANGLRERHFDVPHP